MVCVCVCVETLARLCAAAAAALGTHPGKVSRSPRPGAVPPRFPSAPVLEERLDKLTKNPELLERRAARNRTLTDVAYRCCATSALTCLDRLLNIVWLCLLRLCVHVYLGSA